MARRPTIWHNLPMAKGAVKMNVAAFETLLREKGKSQKQLADALGIGQDAISNWKNAVKPKKKPGGRERGRGISLAEAVGVAEFCQVPLDRVLQIFNLPPLRIRRSMVPIKNYIGAGARVYPIDAYPGDQGMDTVELPAGVEAGDGIVALIVKGDSMFPIAEGSVIFYDMEDIGLAAEHVGKLCVVETLDGEECYVKRLFKGSRANLYTLQSWNAAPIVDVKLRWARPVLSIIPK